ncbi:MAG: paraslipin [Bacteriovoracales bacterium]|nr:paraslipin [Bacteriovoracales bacterium]
MDIGDFFNLVVWGIIFLVVLVQFVKSICIVPTKTAYVVERFGEYHRTLGPGFHALIPFVDKTAYIHDLKEEAIDVPPQECFSKDEVKVTVDGVIYISVVDATKASYGVTSYRYAAIQLAQTTTRSVIWKLELDRTFEERDMISSEAVRVLDRAGEAWGMRVHRYEIKNLTPPPSVNEAMERQVTAERERRAILAKSEGDKMAKINMSEGRKKEMINLSEGEMRRQMNEADGKSEEILAVAKATASSIEKVALAVEKPSGKEAIRLQIAEKFLSKLQGLAKEGTRVILPADATDLNSWLRSVGLERKK